MDRADASHPETTYRKQKYSGSEDEEVSGFVVGDRSPKTESEASLWALLIPFGGQLYAQDWATFWTLVGLLLLSIGSIGLDHALGRLVFAGHWLLGLTLNGLSCRRFNEQATRFRPM